MLRLLPKLQRGVVVRWRIHVEKAQALGIEAADFIFVNFAGANFVVEKNRPQLAALELLVQKRCDAASVNSVQRLKAFLPERHDHIAVRDLRQEMRNQREIEKRRIAGGDETNFLGGGFEAVVNAAHRTLIGDLVAHQRDRQRAVALDRERPRRRFRQTHASDRRTI